MSLSDEALAEYMNSKGQSASIALAEEGRRDSSLHSDRADPTRQLDPTQYTAGELEALKTGDATRYIEEQHDASPQGQREAQQERERQTWAQYQALQDELKATKRERDQYAEAHARKDERIRLFNEAFEEDPYGEQQRAYQQQVANAYHQARTNPGLDPVFALRVANERLDALERERNYQAHIERYKDAAIRHDMANPGYVGEIYPAFLQSERASIKATAPHLNDQQVNQLALQREAALHDRALQQGRDPHRIIHELARNRGIYSQAERDYLGDLDRRAREKAQRDREQAQQDAAKRERDRVQGELARRGGLTYRDAHSHDPNVRRLWQEAKKHGLIRGGL
jgi:hypothetical protein